MSKFSSDFWYAVIPACIMSLIYEWVGRDSSMVFVTWILMSVLYHTTKSRDK